MLGAASVSEPICPLLTVETLISCTVPNRNGVNESLCQTSDVRGWTIAIQDAI